MNLPILKHWLFFSLFLILAGDAYAQPAIRPRNITPGGLFDTIFDGNGSKYLVGELSTNDTVRTIYSQWKNAGNDIAVQSSGGGEGSFHMSAMITPTVSCGTPGYFRIFLDAGCGMEDYATDPDHAARLNVLCQVLTDISNFIPSPALLSSGQKVNLWVKNTSAASGILGGAVPFYYVPNSPSKSGIADNAIWVTHHSGSDAFTNVAPPLSVSGGGASGSSFFHASLAINWSGAGLGASFSWHTDLTTAPAAGEIDLYTVMLHEITHAMGFATLVTSSGNSVFGPGLSYYSRYDRHLKTSGGAALITSTATCTSMYQSTFNSAASSSLSPFTPCATDFTVCGSAIRYVGSWPLAIPVYNPPCFESGSSLSHFEDQCYVPSDTVALHPGVSWNNEYYLMSNGSPAGIPAYSYSTHPGAMKRYFKPEERQALCDMGYAVGTSFGNSANLNNVTYSSGACPGIGVAGINDGITGGAFSYVGTPASTLAIPISSILSNDYNATSVSCVDVVIGNGSASINPAGSIDYTSTSTDNGVVLLRYLPTNGTSTGNITYIYVYIATNSCSTSICDLVKNGGFESATWSGALRPDCWDWYSESVDLCERGATTSLPIPFGGTDVHPMSVGTNDHFLHGAAGQMGGGLYIAEALSQTLVSGLVNGQDYTIKFWAKLHESYPTNDLSMTFAASPSAALTGVPSLLSGFPAGLIPLHTFIITQPDTCWRYYSQTITYHGATGNSLVVMPEPWLDPLSTGHRRFLIDDISIEPLSSVCTFSLTPTMCSTDPPFALSASCGSGTFSWLQLSATGTPTVVPNSTFDPAAAHAADAAIGGVGYVTVRYDYTDVLGCPRQASSSTQIDPNIFGVANVCVGSTMQLSSIASGGSWSSSNTSIATVNATGIVSGASAGSAVISYTLPSGCFSTMTMTVLTSVPPITGPTSFCANTSVFFNNTTPGGTWSTNIASCYSTPTYGFGAFVGYAGASGLITYSLGGSCIATFSTTVMAYPNPISGPSNICIGSLSSLSSTTTGGVWTSSNTNVATIDPATGNVTSVNPGVTVIKYTIPPGCYQQFVLTVNPIPSAITGNVNICQGTYTFLGNSATGGSWSSSNTSICTVFPSAGFVTGVTPGTAVITYGFPSGGSCVVTTTVTVDQSPSVISGITTICNAPSTTLTNSVSGGVWTSNNSNVATIDPSTGVVSSVNAGTTNITYSIGVCRATTVIHVNTPGPITGPSSVCEGSNITLSNSVGGGMWVSGDASIATVDPILQTITGASAGVVDITYDLGLGCQATRTLVVNPLPSPIINPGYVCTGSTITLSDASIGGSWTSDNTNIATIDVSDGVVTPVTIGSVNITYTNAYGCYIYTPFTVNQTPTPIIGQSVVCLGGYISLSDATTISTDLISFGQWSSSNTNIATVTSYIVGSSPSWTSVGDVQGVSVGTSIISYSVNGCDVSHSVTVTTFPITGAATICLGSTTTALSNEISGGNWTSSNASIATIDPSNGMVAGVGVGNTVITYSFDFGCISTFTLSVASAPSSITGLTSICSGTSAFLSTASSGGVWSSDNTVIASIDPSSGLLTGGSSGTTTITYTPVSGCNETISITVNSSMPPITGPTGVCIGATINLSNAGGPGTWSSSNTLVATVDPTTGIVTGNAAGTTTITYANGGCYATINITADAMSAITGVGFVCNGTIITLSNVSAGGAWSSDNSSVASIGSSTGVLTGGVAGSTTITYTMPSGCYATTTITVSSSVPPITGPDEACIGGVVLSNAAGPGTWSSSNSAVATVFPAMGWVSAVSPGVVNITYTTGSCSAVRTLTVNPAPVMSGFAVPCVGLTMSLSSTVPGSTWSSDGVNSTINATTGLLTCIAAGTATVTCTTPKGCKSYALFVVWPQPGPIIGASAVCTGSTIALSDAATGGTWTSGNTTIATINPLTGVLTAVTAGTVTVTYALNITCSVTKVVTIYAQPGAILGASSVCAGSQATLSNAVTGGMWTTSNTNVATINSSTRVLTGITSGTVTVTYTNGICSASRTFTVNPVPSAITGASSVCMGSAIQLSNSVNGGTWTSSVTTRATVSPSGVVSTVATGTTTITYALAGGCSTIKTLTVNPVPAAITGPSAVCVNATITVNTTSSGGSWSTSNTNIATINPTTRVVSGVSAGVINVSYILPTGCYTVKTVSVNATPPAILGGSAVCVGSGINLSNTMGGGTWSSSSTTLATVTLTGGVVTGAAAGTPSISYILSTGCYAIKTVTVNPLPTPITGANTVCLGSVAYVGRLSDAVGGGTWSSSNTTVATIVANTGVVKGVTAGATVIKYTLSTGCFTTTSVTVIAIDPACTPCSQFSGGFTALTGTVTGVALPGGNYYVGSDIHIAGAVAIANGIILIAPGVSIIVDPTAAFALTGSHLFSCDMWQGIVLASTPGTGGTTGAISISGDGANRSSLIEDAIRAVDITNPKTPFSPPYFIYTNNVIFNKNNTGIYIEGYGKTSPLTYEFRVENTVFTSRNFYGLGTYSFPSTWPSTTGTGGLKTSSGTSPYYAPYYIRNYVYQPCNNDIGVHPLTVGIDIISVGAQSGTNYAGVRVGELPTSSANTQLNLFDQLCIGIWGINANVTSNNNIFNEMRFGGDKTTNPHNNGGVGIYTMMDNGGQYKLAVEPTINVTIFPPAILSATNSFYNCKYGVYSYNYWEVSGRSAYMITNQTTVGGTSSGIYGYDVQTYPHKNVTLNNNTIVNVANGISVKLLTGGKKRALYLGSVEANYNTIRAVPAGASVTGITYVDKAITIENSISHLAGSILSSTQATAHSNTLISVYNGIQMSGFDVQAAASNSNQITAVEYGATPKPIQFGISHANCVRDEIAYNNITGTNATNTNWYGVKVANNNLHYVQCNNVSTVGVGYQFDNCVALSRWTGNTMTNNRRGFSMYLGQIGLQGSNFLTPADNKWLGSTWGGLNWQTYMNSALPGSSPMYVRAGAIPTVNVGSGSAYVYSFTNGLLSFSGGYFPACSIPVVIDGGVSSSAGHLKQIVKNEVEYQQNPPANAWIGQFTVWQMLNRYPDEFAGDATLDAFKEMAATSRFKLFTDMENLLSEGEYEAAQELMDTYGIEDLTRSDTDTVTGVIMADNPAANKIVANYRAFYRLYINYEANTLTGSDSVEIEYLSTLCPYTNGPVVYKARAMYDLVFDTLRIFENGCDDTAVIDTSLSKLTVNTDPTKANTTITTIAMGDGQKYLLYPNPNNGNFTLQQKVSDKEPVIAEIWDVVGRSIYKESIRFDRETTDLRIMNGPPGMYVLQLTDSKNRKFRFKFVVE